MGKKEDQKVTDELLEELDSVGGDLEEKAATKGEESDFEDDKPEREGEEEAENDDSKDDSKKESKDKEDDEDEDDESKDSKDSKDEEDEESDDEEDSEDDEESEDSEDSDEEDDEDEEEDDEEDDSTKGDRVPVSTVAKIREKFRGKVSRLKARIAELEGKPKPTEADSKETESEVKALAEKYEMDEPAVNALLEVAAKIAEKRIRENLKLGDGEVLAEAAKMVMQQKEVAHFDKEWVGTEPAVRTAYPNATSEQLAQAKTLMDRLSHRKEFHKFPLDYVLFKNSNSFDKIMRQPKRKTLERGSTGSRASDTSETSDVPYEKMSPKQQERYERQLFSASESSGTFVTRGGKRVRVDD